MKFRPLIEIRNGNKTKRYIEMVWPVYRKMKRTRKLAEVIEMLTVAELPVQPLEIKLAQIFIVLENLKSTYAKSKNIPYCNGAFREVSNPPRNLRSERKLSFKSLLMMMFQDVGMNPSLKKIIKLRNEIIHFGLSRKPYKSLRNDYDYCHDIVREYLLRFMNYEGEYLLYSHAARAINKL